jgi:hypothetical protein
MTVGKLRDQESYAGAQDGAAVLQMGGGGTAERRQGKAHILTTSSHHVAVMYIVHL